jgi:hypothetical protein
LKPRGPEDKRDRTKDMLGPFTGMRIPR